MFDQPVFASEVVRYHGEPVAAVAADHPETARRAAAAVAVDYELLEPWHRKRYLVLPGMTGLWQVAGRSSLGFDDLVRLDFYYLEHWSIWLDVSILLKTVPAVLGARGAY